MEVALRRVEPGQLGRCAAILAQGRAFQESLGFVQWADGYPGTADVAEDLGRRQAWGIWAGGELAGYLALGFDGEPDYDAIDGVWGADGPFAVVHRLAVADGYRGCGLASRALALVKERCRRRAVDAVRIDTGLENVPMQRLLTRAGYLRRGIVQVQNGPRIAYDKLL